MMRGLKYENPSTVVFFLEKLQQAMVQLQQIQKQHANQQGGPFSPRDRGAGGSKPPVVPPISLPLPLPLPLSSAGGHGFGDRPTPTKAQLTMPPRLNHKNNPGGLVSILGLSGIEDARMRFQFQGQPPRLDLPPEESTDLEELEQFAKMFKQKRIKLGK